jgi:hypothetical protein
MNLQEVSFIAPCTSSGADKSLSGHKKEPILHKKIFAPISLIEISVAQDGTAHDRRFPEPLN